MRLITIPRLYSQWGALCLAACLLFTGLSFQRAEQSSPAASLPEAEAVRAFFEEHAPFTRYGLLGLLGPNPLYAWRNDEKRILYVSPRGQKADLIEHDLMTGKEETLVPNIHLPNRITLSQDEERLVLQYGASVGVISLTEERIQYFTGLDEFWRKDWTASPDGRYVIGCGFTTGDYRGPRAELRRVSIGTQSVYAQTMDSVSVSRWDSTTHCLVEFSPNGDLIAWSIGGWKRESGGAVRKGHFFLARIGTSGLTSVVTFPGWDVPSFKFIDDSRVLLVQRQEFPESKLQLLDAGKMIDGGSQDEQFVQTIRELVSARVSVRAAYQDIVVLEALPYPAPHTMRTNLFLLHLGNPSSQTKLRPPRKANHVSFSPRGSFFLRAPFSRDEAPSVYTRAEIERQLGIK